MVVYFEIESGRQNLTRHRYGSIRLFVILVKDDVQEVAQLEQSFDVGYLELLLIPESVEQVDEQLLSLLVPHDLPKGFDVVIR